MVSNENGMSRAEFLLTCVSEYLDSIEAEYGFHKDPLCICLLMDRLESMVIANEHGIVLTSLVSNIYPPIPNYDKVVEFMTLLNYYMNIGTAYYDPVEKRIAIRTYLLCAEGHPGSQDLQQLFYTPLIVYHFYKDAFLKTIRGEGTPLENIKEAMAKANS